MICFYEAIPIPKVIPIGIISRLTIKIKLAKFNSIFAIWEKLEHFITRE